MPARSGALVVAVREAETVATIVQLRGTSRGEGGSTYGHVVIDVGHHAEAVVVLDHTGSVDATRPTSRCSSATAPR